MRTVRYGRHGRFTSRTFFGGAPCSPRAFGLRRAPRAGETCSVGPLKTTRLRNPSPGTLLRGRRIAVPRGAPAYRDERLRPAPAGADPDSIGAFRVTCRYSHMSFDDPIVFPGQPGASHLHMFFGNSRTSASSTAASILSTGGSTCAGGILDRSGYWVPSVIDPRHNRAVLPLYARVYYKTGYLGVPPATVRKIPPGLTMVAGNARATSPQSTSGWDCQSAPGAPYFRYHSPSIPTACPPGALVIQRVVFPQCWDGLHLDSPDHASHMATARNGCPVSHPVPLPVITYTVIYRAPRDRALLRWRLASDSYPADKPGGLSGHADFINGWEPSVLDEWTTHCLIASMNCQGGQTGDGHDLY